MKNLDLFATAAVSYFRFRNLLSIQDFKIPSYLFIGNNEDEAHKLSILKGEHDAILRSLKSRQCLTSV